MLVLKIGSISQRNLIRKSYFYDHEKDFNGLDVCIAEYIVLEKINASRLSPVLEVSWPQFLSVLSQSTSDYGGWLLEINLEN